MSVSNNPDSMTRCTRTLDRIRVTEWVYPAGYEQPRHTHQLASFSFVAVGRYRESFRPHTYSRQPSTVIFHPPQESHAVVFEDPTRIVSVYFSDEKLAAIRANPRDLDEPSGCRTETVDSLGARLRRELRRTDAASELALEGIILELLAEAMRSRIEPDERAMPRWLGAASDFLHDNFTASFALEDVARVAGVHPAHLSRVFRAKFGCTVGEYVRRLRVDAARDQIVGTDLPLSEIALNAGFADQSHFHRHFKRRFGFTPRQYRRESGES